MNIRWLDWRSSWISALGIALSMNMLQSPSADAEEPTSWGQVVGRASAEDEASRLWEWSHLNAARGVMAAADIIGQLSWQRQAQLFGIVEEDGGAQGAIFRQWIDWWEQQVLLPAARLIVNPAVSCNESQTTLRIFQGMERQRQLLVGDERDKPDQSLLAAEINLSNSKWNAIFNALIDGHQQRCRDEALDECIATGRFEHILSYMASEERQMLLLKDAEGSAEWAKGVLAQCAIYDLRFKATGAMEQTSRNFQGRLERLIEGHFDIKPDENTMGGGSIFGIRFDGTTGFVPRLIPLNCTGTMRSGNIVIGSEPKCFGKSFAEVEGRAEILGLLLRHREFTFSDDPKKDLSTQLKVDWVGEDLFKFNYVPGEMYVDRKWRDLTGGEAEESVEVWDTFIRFAYGWEEIVIQTQKRHEYPVLFKFETSVRGAMNDWTNIADVIEFELVHKPQAKPFVPPADPLRQVARPRPVESDGN